MIKGGEEPLHRSNFQLALAREEAGQLQMLEDMVKSSIDMDFPDHLVDSKKEPSVEDKQFEEIICKSLKLADGHYRCDLPFRDPACMLPDSEGQAMDRLMSLKKLRNNPAFHHDYTKFMDALIERGYA